MSEYSAHTLDSGVRFSGKVGRVSVNIGPANPEAENQADSRFAEFTREEFESALDKASRPQRTSEKA